MKLRKKKQLRRVGDRERERGTRFNMFQDDVNNCNEGLSGQNEASNNCNEGFTKLK